MTHPTSVRSIADRQRGLTLIEALAVILILAVVAAILFPVFAQSHEGSGGRSCVSNMKQLGLAMMQYGQDYDGALPPKQAVVDGKTISWRAELNPYVKSTRIYECPNNPVSSAPDLEHDGLTRSYAVNSSSGGAGGPYAGNNRSVNLRHLVSPGSVILVAESTAAFADFNPLLPGEFAQPTDRTSLSGSMQMHRDRSIFLFADGRVKAIQPILTLGGSAGQPMNLWTVDNSPYTPSEMNTARATLWYAVRDANE